MPYTNATTKKLGIKFDAVPQAAVSVVASFAELRFVDGKVRYFDPQPQPVSITDDAMHNLVDPVDGANKGRQLYEMQMHYPHPVPIVVGLYFIDDATEHLIWKVQLAPTDNFGFGEKGFYVLDGCGQLKTAVNTCDAGTGAFAQDIGDETETEFLLTHSFGTRDLVWAIRENDAPYTFVDADIAMTTPNIATVSGFVTPPGADDYRVILMEGDFAQSFGNGTDTSFTIQHNLSTRNVVCSVWEAASPWGSVSVEIAHTDLDNVTVSGFGSAPTTNQYRLVVKKSGPLVSGGYATAFGDGAATSFTITHGKNTQDLIPATYEAATPYGEVAVDTTAASVNTVGIGGFGTAPTASQYRFVMQS